ncbi:MAG: tetratricopeptide repeat protein, partial [Promethearchaeota archaeon]
MSITELINKEKKIVYLVGAGISMDAPSSLPSATQFSKVLLDYCTPREESAVLLSLPGLRYEMVVERVQANFDENLQFLDYLELINTPNLIHLFLAHEIINKHPVITTNFDFLIEHALLKNLPEDLYKQIFPIITKTDYLQYQDYKELYTSGKYPLYKIHGTKKNLITGIDTTSSLITTLTALGKNREEGVTFAIEPFKKITVNNLFTDAVLIVMGYSGNDVFDIGPLIQDFPNFKGIIWIEHSNEDINIKEIKQEDFTNSNNLSSSEDLLLKAGTIHNYPIYQVKANTAKFISELLWEKLISEKVPQNIFTSTTESEKSDFATWVKPIFSTVNEIKKYQIATKLYYDLGQVDKVIECSRKGLKLVSDERDIHFKSSFLNHLGLVYTRKGDFRKALEFIQEALKIDRKFGVKFSIGNRLNNIGYIYRKMEDFDKALEYYSKSLEIFDEINNKKGKAQLLN